MATQKGRPKKFDTKDLMDIINLYIQKNKNKPIRLTATNLANYSTKELGKKAHYQDFTRNQDVKTYIEEFNRTLINKVTMWPNSFDVPIYEKLNIEKFLIKNNTKEKLEKALLRMDTLRERVHDAYGELQDKYVAEMEKKHELESKVKQLENQLKEIEIVKNEEIKRISKELKISKEKNRILRAKNKILNNFLEKHFYETMALYSLYLEGLITSGVEIENPDMIRVEDYKSGNYDLSDVIKAYNSITTNIDSNDESDNYDFEDKTDEIKNVIEDSNLTNTNIDNIFSAIELKETRREKLEEDIFGSKK